MAVQPFVGPWPLFQLLDLFYTIGRTPWTGDQPFAKSVPAHRTTLTQNKRTQTSVLQAVFEPPISVSERAKTLHALECAATLIGVN
jgi:hypothetical protein